MELGSKGAFVAVVLTGVAGTGLVVRLLNEAGYGSLGSVFWFTGYATMVLVLWYGWVRPLDIGTDPTGPADRE